MIVSEDELITRITEDVESRVKPHDPLSIKILGQKNQEKEPVVETNNEFEAYQLFIECLLGMKPNETDTNELLTICEKEFQGNEDELCKVVEFKRDYSADQILWWYMRQSFFDQLLNRALNDENIHMIFLFRSFLADMHLLLQQHQAVATRHVYRGQWMTHDELENLKQAIGQLICIKSFVLASADRNKALTDCDRSDAPNDRQQVVFEIDADSKEAGTMTPFADLIVLNDTSISCEVLFMFGSIYRLLGIDHAENKMSIIRISLCGNNGNDDFKSISESIEEPTEGAPASLQRLAQIVWRMGHVDLAEKYYQYFLNELAANDPLRCAVYANLSQLAIQRGDHEAGARWLTMAMYSDQTTTIQDGSPDQVLGCISKWKVIERLFFEELTSRSVNGIILIQRTI